MNNTLLKILPFLSDVHLPQRKFFLGLITVFSCFVGRANFRNLSRHSSFCEKTLSRNFRKEFPFRDFNTLVIEHELGVDREFIAVIDKSFIKKSGKCTYGLDWYWSGCAQRVEKGLELSCIGIVDVRSSTCFGLDVRQTNTSQKRNVQTNLQVSEVAKHLHTLKTPYIVGDCDYSTNYFINEVKKQSLNFVGKFRRDVVLYWKYEGKNKKKRGRPKKYAGRVQFTDTEKRWKKIRYPDNETIIIRTATAISKALKREVQIVHVKSDTGQEVKLFSTDLELSALKIIEYYHLRFQIEFLFRDAKQHVGLQDCQSTNKDALHTHFNASISTLNMLKIQDRNERGIDEKKVFSIDSLKRRNANKMLLNLFLEESGLDKTCIKIQTACESISKFNAIAS